jgi:TP901 family phage tail tape measure protein
MGDKAGQTLGQRVAGGLSKNRNMLTAFGATGGAAFAAMTEGAILFEDQLRTIQTVAPDIDLTKVGNDIKALAAETGKTTDDLTAGFYDLVSAGVSADDAIGVLRESAKFATGALGSTGEAVDLVTSVMNAYGLEAKDSARITDVFAKAVADGKVTASELGQSIATVAPLAAQMGIEMEEVSASAAVLTAQGFSAGEAFTNMRQAMSALLTPNVTLNKLQEETGKNFADVAREKGLATALAELRIATKGNNDEFGRALGSTQALSFALASTGENYDAFGNQVTETFETSGLATEQYNIKSQSMAEQAKRTAAQLHNLALDAGAVVAPFGTLLFSVNQLAPGLRGLISPAKLLGGILK